VGAEDLCGCIAIFMAHIGARASHHRDLSRPFGRDRQFHRLAGLSPTGSILGAFAFDPDDFAVLRRAAMAVEPTKDEADHE
jgi:hypothetical protein